MTPVTTLGIASPCSSCSNRRSLPDSNGLPACPRAVLLQQQKDAQVSGVDFTPYQHLTLTGLEANPFSTDASAGSFANPVYDLGNSSIYVWVARLVDNQGEYDAQNNLAVPPLTDPSFLTDYLDHIQCMALPMVPADTLAQYYSRGRIKEGEQVLITAFEGQQVNPAGQQEIYGGVVSKIATHRSFPVNSRPTKDDHPRGT